MVERNMCNAVMRGTVIPPGSKSTSRANGLRRNLGYPTSGCRLRVRSRVRRSASGRRGAVADDARAWEVGRGHSSCEAGEQGRAICCGVGGAKGRGQGECAPSKHAPDTVPGSACHTRWPHAYHRVSGFQKKSPDEWGLVCKGGARDRARIRLLILDHVGNRHFEAENSCQHLAAPLKDAVEGDEGGGRGGH